MYFVGENDAGRCVAVNFLRQLFALRTGAAFGNVGIDRDKPAVGQRGAADFKRLSVRASPFKMVGFKLSGPLKQGLCDWLRVARAIFAALCIESEYCFQVDARRDEFGGQVEQAQKLGIAQR